MPRKRKTKSTFDVLTRKHKRVTCYCPDCHEQKKVNISPVKNNIQKIGRKLSGILKKIQEKIRKIEKSKKSKNNQKVITQELLRNFKKFQKN